MKKRIAIIGAGISGLILAQQLKQYFNVTVYEKARGVGGRMSTRYAEPFYFDHGTQCFTARTHAFRRFLQPFMVTKTVEAWSGKVINLEIGKKETKRLWFEPHLVASPNMNSLCKALAEGVDIALSTQVAPVQPKSTPHWLLHDKDRYMLGEYDWIISTAPPAQTVQLFEHILHHNDTPLHAARMQGCYSLMIGYHQPWHKRWIAAKVRNNPIKWISINSSKPQRNKNVTSIVAHSRNDWADKHIDDDMHGASLFIATV